MHRLNVLILQARPSHQIVLHQACNAQGVFRVRVAADLRSVKQSLSQTGPVDALIADHGMPPGEGRALLKHLRQQARACALLFVGEPPAEGTDLAREARRQQFWVVAQLPWPLPVAGLQTALLRLHASTGAGAQTVTSPAHAH